MRCSSIIATVAICSLASVASAGGTSHLHHEGVVTVLGERFTGQGAFRFALVDPDTNAYLWTNDGSGVADPDPPINPVVLQVVNGVYNVGLGDATVTNMTAVPSAVFSENANVVLRAWFDDLQGNGVHVLSPDLKITTSPYSVQARTAVQLNIPDTDTAAVFVDGTGNVGIGLTDPSARLDVDGTTELNGDVTINSDLTVDTNTLVVNGTAGNVGIGTTSPAAPLHISGDLAELRMQRASDSDETMVRLTTGDTTDWLFGMDSAPASTVRDFSIKTTPNASPEFVIKADTGKVGIGTSDPQSALDVDGVVASIPYVFHAYGNTNVLLPKEVSFIVPFGEVLNPFDLYNQKEARFTAPVDGIYRLTTHIGFCNCGSKPASEDTIQFGFWLNGSTVKNELSVDVVDDLGDTFVLLASNDAIIALNAGDSLQVVLHGMGTAQNRVSLVQRSFSAAYLGKTIISKRGMQEMVPDFPSRDRSPKIIASSLDD